MKSYTHEDGRTWTGSQRMDSYKKTKLAIAKGEIPPATVCDRCKQDKGLIAYHNHDYDHPTQHLEALCWRCHMMHHSQHFAPLQVNHYFDEVAKGKQWPPVFRHDFEILARDHGVRK